ncbi:hypothetical protein CLOM_g14610 [Closterium sp. NIES-68]|nr:hypothetical protein CLOM_g14610 [Closterium sp. NIES-68]GJP82453.1 hypothetical protein CLOP_g12712 [Closterium sp. NIES-67]
MFPPHFVFGTATAAYQVEGAATEGGRGPSIWDEFSHTPGKTRNGDTGDVACDQYHRYQEDIALMVSMGVKAYRFSISWPRIMPTGRPPVNPEGVAYYCALIQALLDNGITPYVTLYHWDLPLALEKEFGGWRSPEVVPCFRTYADTCFALFGRSAPHWITLNEPLCFTLCGYQWGIHAPGRSSNRLISPGGGDSCREPYLVMHHLLLAHAAAVDAFRLRFGSCSDMSIGLAVDGEWAEPLTSSPPDVEAAERRMVFQLAWVLDPLFSGLYPALMRQRVGARLPSFTAEQQQQLRGSLDFVGVNHYTSKFVSCAAAAAAAAAASAGGGAADGGAGVANAAESGEPLEPPVADSAAAVAAGVVPLLPHESPALASSAQAREIEGSVGAGACGEEESDHFKDQAVEIATSRNGIPIGERAASEWLYIVPWGFTKLLNWISARYNRPPILITENGMDDDADALPPLDLGTLSPQPHVLGAQGERVQLGEQQQPFGSVALPAALDDWKRVNYYNDYLAAVADAIRDGADVRGYFAWSLLDNFEWAMGYSRRFGTHYVDFAHGADRLPKRSALWWRHLLR